MNVFLNFFFLHETYRLLVSSVEKEGSIHSNVQIKHNLHLIIIIIYNICLHSWIIAFLLKQTIGYISGQSRSQHTARLEQLVDQTKRMHSRRYRFVAVNSFIKPIPSNFQQNKLKTIQNR